MSKLPNTISYESKLFFSNLPSKAPQYQACIVWLSPKMFTEAFSANIDFSSLYNNNKSITQLYEQHLLFGKRGMRHIQRGKLDGGQESYRPYFVFYNEPAMCTFAIPLSTTFSFQDNPQNDSFFSLNLKLFKYLH